MLNSFRRWVSGEQDAPDPDLQQVTEWAARRGVELRRIKDDVGFVVEGAYEGHPWRLEWGPPQRSYIHGRELRLRIELGLPRDLQMLLLSRSLMETLESQTFEQFTADMKTQIDVATPDETRWVAMFPKVPLAAAKELKRRFVAVAWSPTSGAAWIDGPVSQRLIEASRGPLATDVPFVLMTLRGRIYLRLQLLEPEITSVVAMLALFETAASQAVRLGESVNEGENVWPAASSTAWQTLMPAEDTKDDSNRH